MGVLEYTGTLNRRKADPMHDSPTNALVARIERLERSNRHMRIAVWAVLIIAGASSSLGFQAARKVITADDVVAQHMKAESFSVVTDKGVVRLDAKGLTIAAPCLTNDRRTQFTEMEARIEIGLDNDWTQENALRPTPRVAVGRTGKDTSSNLVTRITAISPEGCHSGEWHVNNPSADGRTDRQLIDDLKRR
jgi:hypothetical protein